MVSDVCDHIHLHQRVARNPARRGDGSAHRRILAELLLKHFVHSLVVLQVVQKDAALQHLVHGRAGVLQLLLNLIQYVGRVRFDVARKMRAYSGDEEQIAVGNRTAEQRRSLGLVARVVDLLLGSGLRFSGSARGSRQGASTNECPPV